MKQAHPTAHPSHSNRPTSICMAEKFHDAPSSSVNCGFDWRNSMSLNNQTVGGGMWTCISKLQYAEEMNMNDSQFIHMRRNPKTMGKALLVAPSLFKCVTTLSQLESSRCSLRYIPHRANNFSPKKAHTQFACHPVMCWVFDFCISFPLCHRASAFTHSLFLWSALDVRPSRSTNFQSVSLTIYPPIWGHLFHWFSFTNSQRKLNRCHF